MSFKMKEWSAFTKETRFEGERNKSNKKTNQTKTPNINKRDENLSAKAVENFEQYAATNPIDTTGQAKWDAEQAVIRQNKIKAEQEAHPTSKTNIQKREKQEEINRKSSVYKPVKNPSVDYEGSSRPQTPGRAGKHWEWDWDKKNPIGPKRKSGSFTMKGWSAFTKPDSDEKNKQKHISKKADDYKKRWNEIKDPKSNRAKQLKKEAFEDIGLTLGWQNTSPRGLNVDEVD